MFAFPTRCSRLEGDVWLEDGKPVFNSNESLDEAMNGWMVVDRVLAGVTQNLSFAAAEVEKEVRPPFDRSLVPPRTPSHRAFP